jgi:hypothetical protein
MTSTTATSPSDVTARALGWNRLDGSFELRFCSTSQSLRPVASKASSDFVEVYSFR